MLYLPKYLYHSHKHYIIWLSPFLLKHSTSPPHYMSFPFPSPLMTIIKHRRNYKMVHSRYPPSCTFNPFNSLFPLPPTLLI